ncbi:hypothetical protein H0H92_009604 [Tricholoma furcatifolium]|nr:hypothetical protein H0H92_009604 [Tricholoma furcatifolium]
MHFKSVAVVALLSLTSLAVPLYDIQNEGSLRRSEDKDVDTTGLDWSNVEDKYHQWNPLKNKEEPKQKGKKQKQSDTQIAPQLGVKTTHIGFKTQGGSYVTDYQVFTPNNNPNKATVMDHGNRWRGFGKDHGGVDPPIWYQDGKSQAGQPAVGSQNPPHYAFAQRQRAQLTRGPSNRKLKKAKEPTLEEAKASLKALSEAKPAQSQSGSDRRVHDDLAVNLKGKIHTKVTSSGHGGGTPALTPWKLPHGISPKKFQDIR